MQYLQLHLSEHTADKQFIYDESDKSFDNLDMLMKPKFIVIKKSFQC